MQLTIGMTVPQSMSVLNCLGKKQFVDDEELVMGCAIQRLVCAHIDVSGGERARIYWEEKGGKETVRNTFRRKRQAAQYVMKLAFRRKYQHD